MKIVWSSLGLQSARQGYAPTPLSKIGTSVTHFLLQCSNTHNVDYKLYNQNHYVVFSDIYI